MRDIYILNSSLGFFNSLDKAYYLLVSEGKVFAVDKVSNERRFLGDRLNIKTVRLRIKEKSWVAFSSMKEVQAFAFKIELDITLG